MGKIIFVLGGARSGKSTFAINLAKKTSKKVLYLATAQAKDKEMAERIKLHRKNRPSYWRTVEEPVELLKILSKSIKEDLIIIDCLTLYVSNLITAKEINFKKSIQVHNQLEKNIINNIFLLVKRIKSLKKHKFIIVSNEVGLDVVPANPLARYFRDTVGWVNQILAKNSDKVYFLLSGIPLKIK